MIKFIKKMMIKKRNKDKLENAIFKALKPYHKHIFVNMNTFEIFSVCEIYSYTKYNNLSFSIDNSLADYKFRLE